MFCFSYVSWVHAFCRTEKQEQLIGIHKRFNAEVEQHLQECGSLIANLEEHEIELKISMEKQSMIFNLKYSYYFSLQVTC